MVGCARFFKNISILLARLFQKIKAPLLRWPFACLFDSCFASFFIYVSTEFVSSLWSRRVRFNLACRNAHGGAVFSCSC